MAHSDGNFAAGVGHGLQAPQDRNDLKRKSTIDEFMDQSKFPDRQPECGVCSRFICESAEIHELRIRDFCHAD